VTQNAPILLDALLDDPGRVTELPLEAVVPLLDDLAARAERERRVRELLTARLGTAAPVTQLTEQGPLTQQEAAAYYRIPLRTLRRLTRTKRVPSYLLGKNRMIRPADLDAYLARCRDQGVRVGVRFERTANSRRA
jgi:excisionase family DNA binding protein